MPNVAIRVDSIPHHDGISKQSYNSKHIYSKKYNLLYDIMGDNLKQLSRDSVKSAHTVKLKNLKNYIKKFNMLHSLILSSYDDIVKELYLLHETAKSLEKFNNDVLGLSNQKFRARILYPNIVYILIRMCPNARNFLQTIIKRIYNEINKSSRSIINAHVSSIYLDKEVIKTDILYEFLGNGLKKLNPLDVYNIHGFYTKVFRNIFYYYFKKEQQLHTSLCNIWDIHNILDNNNHSPTRLSIYRDVLYNIQIEKMYKRSPTISQIYYNFSIFQNIVINNELQCMYFSTNTDVNILENNEYKLIKFYDDDLLSNEFIQELKKLPIIYQLLRCIHINNPNVKAHNEMLIKPEVVQHAVIEELMYPFKNFFHENIIYDILSKIAANFTSSILTGEYINPLTLATVKIEQISFITQLKKFINMCIMGAEQLNGNK